MTNPLTTIHGRATNRSDASVTTGAVLGPCLALAAACVAVAVSGIRGADYPAHLMRAELWDRAGLAVWNVSWYGGHSTPTYSVISPPLIAALGPLLVIVIGSIVGTACFVRLVAAALPGTATTLAGYAFALCCVPHVVVGRAPFALGLGLAIAAALAWQRERMSSAVVLAIASGLASPVAGAFLTLAGGAAVADQLLGRGVRSGGDATALRRAVVTTASAAAPLIVLGLVFGSGGRFPFRTDQLVFSVVVAVVVAVLVRRRVVTIAAAMTIVVSVIVYVVPNPLGGNFLRLVQHVGVPLAVTGLALVPRRVLLPTSAFLAVAIGWAVEPGVVAALQSVGDESIHAEYHDPLIDEVQRRNADGEPLGRLEIPFTDNHWESLYVALEVPYARGWERQLDLEHNAVLYEPGLTVSEYRAWLDDNAVRWIAVADVEVDEGGRPEWELLERERRGDDIEWLDLVWTNGDWRLYEVDDHQPIVDAPAELVRQGADDIVVRTPGPATVVMRYRYTEGWSLDGDGCLAPDESGWTVASFSTGGTHHITIDAAEGIDPRPADGCDATGDGATDDATGDDATVDDVVRRPDQRFQLRQ